MTTTPEEKPAMASELIEEVAQALFLTNDPVARWCEWEGEYVQKGEVISIADVYRRAAKAAIDLICERMQERVRAETELLTDAWGALNFILAFYEPGQRYLDTEAWKRAEANGRAVHARLAAAIRETPHAEG